MNKPYEGSRQRRAHGRVLTVVVGGWLLLAVAWAFANPPFAAPDEADHYVHAIGISQGRFVGDPAPFARFGRTAAEIRFTKQTQRSVVVPASLRPAPFACYISDPLKPASCLNHIPRSPAGRRLVTSVGTYPPAGLLAPAAVVTSADDPSEAVRWGRLASLAVSLALLTAALLALTHEAEGWLPLAGVLAASTPMVVFLTASLTPSGLAVSAGIALVGSLLRIGRRERAPAAVWMLFGVSGALLALSHPGGLAWAVLIVSGFVALQGLGPGRRLIARDWRRARWGVGLFALGLAAALAWHAVYGPNPAIGYRGIRPALSHAPGLYWDALRQVVGAFGYLEFRLPLPLYLLWFAFVAGLVLIALKASGPRERRALVIAAVLAVLIPLGGWLFVGRWIGIDICGREFLPLLVGFPMLAGELVYRHRDRIPRLAMEGLAVLAAEAGLLHFVAWYFNGRRSAVGTGGPFLFALHAQWQPPLGWTPWLVLAGCGALMIAAVPLHGFRARRGAAQALRPRAADL